MKVRHQDGINVLIFVFKDIAVLLKESLKTRFSSFYTTIVFFQT